MKIVSVIGLAALLGACAGTPLDNPQARKAIAAASIEQGDQWPALPAPVYVPIPDPEVELSLSEAAVRAYAESVVASRLEIPLGKEGENVGLDYGVITRLLDIGMTARQTLRVRVAGQLHAKAWFVRTNVGIAEFEVELHPYLVDKGEEGWQLEFEAAVTDLKMKDLKDWDAANRYLARAITKSLSRHPLSTPLPDMKPDKKRTDLLTQAVPPLRQMALLIRDGRIVLQATSAIPLAAR